MTTFSLSFLSSLVSSPLHQDIIKQKKKRPSNLALTKPGTELPSPATVICSYSSSTSAAPSSPSSDHQRKRHWKAGEYNPRPKTSEKKFIPKRTDTHQIRRQSGAAVRKTPINNINKKKNLEVKHYPKAGACTVTDSLSDRIKKKQWIEALQVFEMLKEQPFYHPKDITYMKLIVMLGRCGQPKLAHQLFDEMIEQGLDPTCRRYTAILAAYCKSHLLDEAFSVLELMKAHPICQPDVYTYNVLIKACVETDRFEDVKSLYNQMEERSIVPNIITQNIVLKGYAKSEKFDQMEKLLSEMEKPNVQTMNTIISLYGNKGQIEMMEKWYEKFLNMGINPESRTFNILIGAYVRKRQYDKMSTVMENMRKLSISWTTSTYNSVIEAFGDAGDADNMEYTFDQMQEERMRTDTKTFCCLIKGYANAGMFHKVVKTVQLAGRSGVPENTSFCNAVIFSCMKAGDVMEMEKVFMRMKEKGCRPDSLTYSMMIDAYRKADMNDKVFDLEEEKRASSVVDLIDDEDDDEVENVDDEKWES
ncbi:pentatricopeptide repeat-containing protein At3g06430, chloroplastic-like [Impatiens glandulifera]|uniref:pentatricopeptide repeat-containing protein At3g06430, chloroplastic-like n=1 Tax=Impatiens glandulifera TaxID=253017 RepID=UPI001FB0F88F|nr:pentatricopeptide repeat-containing protein At3g06430, chloroplastic-like [Impatiens glandulifera]